MRLLLQPRVLRMASLAAALSTFACYPRLTLWLHRPAPLWYLEATIFVCSTLLWGFVFAWHEPYTRRPLACWPIDRLPLGVATATGIGTAAAFHLWLDPILQSHFPEEYPPDLPHWLAALPFILGFNQLFLIFAPFDWAMRLTQNRRIAGTCIGLLSAALLLLKIHTLPTSLAPAVVGVLLAGRMVTGYLVAWFYWHGGIGLVCWWALLLESRHLLDLATSLR